MDELSPNLERYLWRSGHEREQDASGMLDRLSRGSRARVEQLTTDPTRVVINFSNIPEVCLAHTSHLETITLR